MTYWNEHMEHLDIEIPADILPGPEDEPPYELIGLAFFMAMCWAIFGG